MDRKWRRVELPSYKATRGLNLNDSERQETGFQYPDLSVHEILMACWERVVDGGGERE